MSDSGKVGVGKAIMFHGSRQVRLVEEPLDTSPLAADEVAGRTLVTLVSPGTELNWAFDAKLEKPISGGYAAVFEVEALGVAVTDLKVGQHVFCMGEHRSHQRKPCTQVLPLPQGLAPETAVFARLMGVNWTTLTTTAARPADQVLITGLGPVGNMAAQIFESAGYRVTAIDPLAQRRELAGRCGIRDIRSAAMGHADLTDRVALAVECSGHEQAAIDACRVVRKGGEVVLVGVPWKKNIDAAAFEITHAVFHRFVTLRSGWEWELPLQQTNFARGSIFANFASALSWLAQGRVRVEGLGYLALPQDAQAVYTELLERRSPAPAALFDWRKVK